MFREKTNDKRSHYLFVWKVFWLEEASANTESSHPKNVAKAQTLRSAKDLMTSKKEKVVSVWLLFSEEKSQMLLEVMGSWNP